MLLRERRAPVAIECEMKLQLRANWAWIGGDVKGAPALVLELHVLHRRAFPQHQLVTAFVK